MHPPKQPQIWGAKVVSQGKRRLRLPGKGTGTGLWVVLVFLPHVIGCYLLLSGHGRLARCCKITSDPLALRTSFDAVVQIVTKFAHCFLCTASAKYSAPANG